MCLEFISYLMLNVVILGPSGTELIHVFDIEIKQLPNFTESYWLTN